MRQLNLQREHSFCSTKLAVEQQSEGNGTSEIRAKFVRSNMPADTCSPSGQEAPIGVAHLNVSDFFPSRNKTFDTHQVKCHYSP